MRATRFNSVQDNTELFCVEPNGGRRMTACDESRKLKVEEILLSVIG
jgi:hypothetical protein